MSLPQVNVKKDWNKENGAVRTVSSKQLKPLTISLKNSVVDVWQGFF